MIEVVAADEQHDVAVDLERWQRLAASVLGELLDDQSTGSIEVPVELTLTFIDETEIAALNAEQMGVEAPTDVLAFPLDLPGDGDVEIGGPPVLLGDVVICPAVAERAAPAHAGTLDDELALLVVHGILHLFGHDHAERDPAEVMRSKEQQLLERWYWNGPTPPGFSFEHRDQ